MAAVDGDVPDVSRQLSSSRPECSQNEKPEKMKKKRGCSWTENKKKEKEEEEEELACSWMLTSCQPHRVTWGRSNSVVSKYMCTF